MKIIISCDSTCDLGNDLIKENDIQVMPLLVNLGEKSYQDGVDIKIEDIFDFVDKTGELPKTAARSIYEYEEHFKKCLENGDYLIHISLSSELSSSYSNAKLAADSFDNVIVVDSLSLSTGYGLLVLKACQFAKENLAPTEIEQRIIALVPKVQASFVVNTLKYLYKGGRCSAVAMFGANLLKIKPSILVKDGKMGVGKKYMGKLSDSLVKYTNNLLEENDYNKEMVFITYSSDSSNSVATLEELLKAKGFEKIYKTIAGSTITSHCGPDCLGVLFLNK